MGRPCAGSEGRPHDWPHGPPQLHGSKSRDKAFFFFLFDTQLDHFLTAITLFLFGANEKRR